MAGLNIDLNKDISFGKKSGKPRGKMPSKTSINLVVKKESFLSSPKAVPVIAGCIVIALLLIGLLFVKPLIDLHNATTKVTQLQAELDEANTVIKSQGGIEEEYAHYTTEGMTDEELSRVDRVVVMKLLESAALTNGTINSWDITDNTMSLQVSGASLAELNQIAAALEKQPIVERCVINTANHGNSSEAGNVSASFIVYLTQNAAEEGGQQ